MLSFDQLKNKSTAIFLKTAITRVDLGTIWNQIDPEIQLCFKIAAFPWKNTVFGYSSLPTIPICPRCQEKKIAGGSWIHGGVGFLGSMGEGIFFVSGTEQIALIQYALAARPNNCNIFFGHILQRIFDGFCLEISFLMWFNCIFDVRLMNFPIYIYIYIYI